MVDCQEWLDDITHAADVVLAEDLAALQRMGERSRRERYEELAEREEELVWEFDKECSDFLTRSERDHLRGQLRLARLLLAASFYAEGEVPESMAGDFIEAELQAVVDFDRYKQFDALSEEQIEERIRRMEGEVYELVTEYTSTQLANVDELVDDPDVQQDVIEQLVDRYDERREKIRRGFFTYVETHGLEHMVESIEAAVESVTDASEERERIRETVEAELEDLSTTLDRDFENPRREFTDKLRAIERGAASGDASADALQADLDAIDEDEIDEIHEEAIEDVTDALERTRSLQADVEEKIERLEEVRDQAAAAENERAAEDATALVETELTRLRDERDRLAERIDFLERQRDWIEATHERFRERQSELEERIENLEVSRSENVSDDGGISGGDVVTSSIARLLELDYLGRFDITMDETETLQLSDREFEVPEGYWENRTERRGERARVERLLDGGDVDSYPMNERSRYEVTDSQYFGLSRRVEMVVEAVVLSHLDAYATNDFDAAPADIDDLLSQVNRAVREAEENDHEFLLGIASPTGWTDRVRQQVDGGEEIARTRYSKHVSVCLIDLQDGSLVYDESDALARENAQLFEPPVDAERVADCVAHVREEYRSEVGTDSVLLSDLEADGFDSHVAKRAFNELESDGAGEQLYVDDYGLALDFD